MKSILLIAMAFLLGTGTTYSQYQYQVLKDADGGKIYRGLISRKLIQGDTSFKWYAENAKDFTPDKKGLSALKQNKDSVQLILFMGTWCEDSHFVVPRFFSMLDAAGYNSDKVTVIGVDRDKKTIGHLAEALNLVNVPTIIVMKKGKELGRVVEYGKSGLFDKDLGEVINPAK